MKLKNSSKGSLFSMNTYPSDFWKCSFFLKGYSNLGNDIGDIILVKGLFFKQLKKGLFLKGYSCAWLQVLYPSTPPPKVLCPEDKKS